MLPRRRVSTALSIVAGALTSLSVVSAASAATVILPSGAMWEFTACNPTSDSSWNTSVGTTNGGCGWEEALAPFGGKDPDWEDDPAWDPSFFPPASWVWPTDRLRDGDDLWVRRTIDFQGFNLEDIRWFLGVDNGYKLYLNGQLISSGEAEGFTYRWEYFGGFPGLESTLRTAGPNVIALALSDHGGLTAFDFSASVPEPAVLGLLGLGLGVVAVRRRRRRQ